MIILLQNDPQKPKTENEVEKSVEKFQVGTDVRKKTCPIVHPQF